MSVIIDPTLPTDSESPRQGASRIRNIVLQLLSLVGQGGGSPVIFATNPFNIDTNGNVSIPTSLSIPTPTTPVQAATKGYVDTTISSITFTSPGTPAPTVGLLSPVTIPAGSSGTVFSFASTPPSIPNSTQAYRALISCTVFFETATIGTTTSLLLNLSDSKSIFSNHPCGSGHSSTADTPSINFSAVSDLTATSAGGAVTFTVTGAALSGSGYTNAILVSASSIGPNSRSNLSIAWIPAI